MAETLSFISIIAFVAAAICLVVTIIIFIKFKIPSVIGDLSGKTARKSIEQMRESNEQSGRKTHERKTQERPETGLLEDNRIQSVVSTATVLLQDENTEGLLEDENTTVALDFCEEAHFAREGGIAIELLEEIMLIHTEEDIL